MPNYLMIRLVASWSVCLLIQFEARAAEEPPALVPRPVQCQTAPGSFTLSAKTVLVARGEARAEAVELADALRPATGFRLAVVGRGGTASCVRLELVPSLAAQFGTEGYRLSVRPDRVQIQAASPAGLFYGGVTFRQLLPPEILAANRLATPPAGGCQAPCVEIEDSPRFVWRGLLVDVARHYLPPEFLYKLVDLLALHKLNHLQLHLTDDQGWRLEIKKYPRLTQVGSRRKESPKPGDRNAGDGTPYGPYFYSQAQMRALVAYAEKRHVTLVPEIELPGHFGAAVAAYPKLSCTGGPFEVRTRWGIHPDILCVGNDSALRFAEDVLEEVMRVFPGQFVHIGGDEAPRDRWKACAKCQARLHAEGLHEIRELQGYLNRRLEAFLSRKGRRLIGWDEILEGGLPARATVMSWRGIAGGITAAQGGHDVVMSPTSHCYFDYAQGKGAAEPESIGGFLPLETVYAYDPMPRELSAKQPPHLLGVQGNVWTEFIRTPRDVEYFSFPRAVALAEVAWTPIPQKNWADFSRRLAVHYRRLDQLQVNYRARPTGSP